MAIAAGIMTLAPGAFASNSERARAFFDHLDRDHLELVNQFYDQDVAFQDPVHQLKGVAAVRSYYAGLYKNVESIRFEYSKALDSGNTVTLAWRMYLKSPSIGGGKEITVDGVSLITFGGKEGKAITHRDYFDMGEFVYERIPVLRTVIGFIKKKLAQP